MNFACGVRLNTISWTWAQEGVKATVKVKAASAIWNHRFIDSPSDYGIVTGSCPRAANVLEFSMLPAKSTA
jgi:hypothetical protein